MTVHDMQTYPLKKRTRVIVERARQHYGELSGEVASAKRVADATLQIITSPASAPLPQETYDALDSASRLHMEISDPSFFKYLYPRDKPMPSWYVELWPVLLPSDIEL